MQDSEGDTDIKKRLSDSVGGEGGMIWENSTETYTLLYVKQKTSVSLIYDAGHPNQEGWGGEGGGKGGSGWRGDMYTYGRFIIMSTKTITIL